MTQEEIAHFLGVKKSLVRRWRAELDLPHTPTLHKFLTWAADKSDPLQSASRDEAIDMMLVYRKAIQVPQSHKPRTAHAHAAAKRP